MLDVCAERQMAFELDTNTVRAMRQRSCNSPAPYRRFRVGCHLPIDEVYYLFTRRVGCNYFDGNWLLVVRGFSSNTSPFSTIPTYSTKTYFLSNTNKSLDTIILLDQDFAQSPSMSQRVSRSATVRQSIRCKAVESGSGEAARTSAQRWSVIDLSPPVAPT